MKKIIIALLALATIIGGIFGVTKAREYSGQSNVYDSQNEVVCLYGCPSVKRRKFIKIK